MKTSIYSTIVIFVLLLSGVGGLLAEDKETATGDWDREYFSFRLNEPNGIGVGLNAGYLRGGFITFYDYTLTGDYQVHVQYNFNGIEVRAESCDGRDEYLTMPVQRNMLYVTLRRFFSRSYGWYAGVGLGYARTSLEYNSVWTSDFSFTGSGIFAVAEAGWQGNHNYYFHVGISPAVYISYQDDFESDKLPKSYWKGMDDPKYWWNESKKLHSLSVGFGWFF